MSPILWLWSPRTEQWVSFMPYPTDPNALLAHRCPAEGGQSKTWRDLSPRREPSPDVADRAHAGAALAREVLASKTENESPADSLKETNHV
jgi:hypothetical protein